MKATTIRPRIFNDFLKLVKSFLLIEIIPRTAVTIIIMIAPNTAIIPKTVKILINIDIGLLLYVQILFF
ncbi:hypothetical protein A2223_03095 [Candidatus Falkowbacteria bacterium RIFOXYA2_FULL_35_8]|uniref:Uncharacterized protein n=1 Tax=Candidatus Falkowbacteria bacterium RIFOXYC2_FULL_36_12 TaxID=1798002 RepID=A0A1F5T012_9BACT|nr:MAG: hypothetical protein A2300_00330 [Candidatus Falkowbacteria bacterium RIFOXYB2_FULL_35_7]OGF32259.1 MAG: hypothetical protein A2478_02955 [Candidatus Falkowbacteria bacterium RIFOXYC2_FULL_36_12]OGF33875.1 MAG: hypothetical protein A2223_03095 [Candidatus Falkowbacteria bacterium RIFOXYA2_FULL_35_8]